MGESGRQLGACRLLTNSFRAVPLNVRFAVGAQPRQASEQDGPKRPADPVSGFGAAKRERLKEVVKELDLNWRSWWTGSQNNDISRRWNIPGYPSMFLIDAEGVLRYGFDDLEPGATLEGAINTLLAEAAKGRKS